MFFLSGNWYLLYVPFGHKKLPKFGECDIRQHTPHSGMVVVVVVLVK